MERHILFHLKSRGPPGPNFWLKALWVSWLRPLTWLRPYGRSGCLTHADKSQNKSTNFRKYPSQVFRKNCQRPFKDPGDHVWEKQQEEKWSDLSELPDGREIRERQGRAIMHFQISSLFNPGKSINLLEKMIWCVCLSAGQSQTNPGFALDF